MRVLQKNYLDQLCEDLEIIDFRLNSLFEAAVAMPTTKDDDDFSLLSESIDDHIEIMNEEAFELYTEALDNALKKIWSGIVRFVKSIFVSSGTVITSEEAKRIIEIANSAAEAGKLEGPSMKKIVQKGFYLIAGLGSTVNGDELRRAYDAGDTANFVMHNLNKIKVKNIQDDSRFRVCIATYPDNVKNSMTLIGKIFEVLIKDGLSGIEKMGKAAKTGASVAVDKMRSTLHKESVDDIDLLEEKADLSGIKNAAEKAKASAEKAKESAKRAAKFIGDATGASEFAKGSQHMSNAKYAEKMGGKDSMADDKAIAREMMVSGGKKLGATAAGAAGISLLALGVVHLVKVAKAKAGGDHIAMATITYVNENKPNAQAVVRLYGVDSVKKFTLQGHDKVVALRDGLVTLADRMATEGDNLGAGAKEYVMEFANNIVTFFSALATKGSSKK